MSHKEREYIGRYEIARNNLTEQFWRLRRAGGGPLPEPFDDIYSELRTLNSTLGLLLDGLVDMEEKRKREEAGGDG